MCKMAHFGNCDLETADQEYCIFHKPNKSEEEAVEFYRKFLERFKPRVEEIEVEGDTVGRPEIVSIAVIRFVFEKEINARGFVFPKIPDEDIRYTDKNGNLFIGHFSFIFSVFEEEVSFSSAIFEEMNFSLAHFKKDALFINCKFEDIDFSQAIFEGNANFMESRFERAMFDNTYFESAIFTQCEFKKADFFASYFKIASFKWAKFEYEVDFSEAIFCYVDLEDSLFNGEVEIIPIPMKLVGLSPSSIEQELIERFCDPITFMEAAKIQRIMYERLGDRERADIMFVLEMRAKRRARIKNARNKLEKLKAHTHNFIEWLLADLPSEYGTNWVRLFLFSLLVIIGNAVPYAFWSAYIEGFPQTPNYLIRFANALYYSLVTFTTLGYGDMHPTGWLKALSALEALTGAVFMALIVAVIARKWMR